MPCCSFLIKKKQKKTRFFAFFSQKKIVRNGRSAHRARDAAHRGGGDEGPASNAHQGSGAVHEKKREDLGVHGENEQGDEFQANFFVD